MANKIITQSGKEVFAVGQDGSHARNLVQFDITLPKLIDKLFRNWSRGGLDRHTEPHELYAIMYADEVKLEDYNSLYQSAYYYFTVEKN